MVLFLAQTNISAHKFPKTPADKSYLPYDGGAVCYQQRRDDIKHVHCHFCLAKITQTLFCCFRFERAHKLIQLAQRAK